MVNIDIIKSLVTLKGGFARPNLFAVQLPGLTTNLAGADLNILCKDVNIPGRQMLTVDREVGQKREKVVYGAAYEDVTMTFWLMNDYGVKEYFERWQEQSFDSQAYQMKYKSEYQKDIVIYQLKKNYLSPIDLVLNNKIYTVKLENAVPTTMNSIPLSNDLDNVAELQVTLSYTRWTSSFENYGTVAGNIIQTLPNITL